MKVVDILENDAMPRIRPLCKKCGGKLIRGTDMTSQKKVMVCPKCRQVQEHAAVIFPKGGMKVFLDTGPRKRLQTVLKVMKKSGLPREERLRQVKSYKLFKAVEKDDA